MIRASTPAPMIVRLIRPGGPVRALRVRTISRELNYDQILVHWPVTVQQHQQTDRSPHLIDVSWIVLLGTFMIVD